MARDDLSETLEALERRLRDLERELGAPAPAAPSVAPPPVSTGGGLDDLARQVDDLGRFRAQLERVGRELEEEYARVMARLRTDEPAPPPVVEEPAPVPEPVDDVAQPAGTVVVDAGPFSDLAALGALEAAVGGIAGVEAAEVTGFEGRRALLTVTLAAPVALETELRRALALPVVRAVSAPGRLTLDLGP
jgi:hypothetical protein